MATPVFVPKLDEAMIEAKIVEWFKQDGDRVEKGEAILEIETEKVNFEIEAEESGILRIIAGEKGEVAKVGTVVAYILQPGETIPETIPTVEATPVIKEERETIQVLTVETPVRTSAPPTQGGKIKASPLAKKTAREHKIDLTSITGTGPGGKIVEADVLAMLEEARAASAVRA